jgi:hypothetical protein
MEPKGPVSKRGSGQREQLALLVRRQLKQQEANGTESSDQRERFGRNPHVGQALSSSAIMPRERVLFSEAPHTALVRF